MGKSKGKKRGLAQLTLHKKVAFKARNPFEVQVNKQKFVILGRKSKNDRGLPGVARAKSINKRKETLLQEYRVKDKSNKFVDRRIGERNSSMTREDRIMARFAAEKMKAHNKKTQYNLSSEEILTHRGRCLAEVDKFDDPRSDQEDEEDHLPSSGALSASFVSEAHFGGGVLRKKSGSRLSVIEELIADSKRRKVESQQAREKTLELTDRLDQDWKELLPMLEIGKPPQSETPNRDPYDILMKQLIFDPRGKPSERLKSEEEMVAEEARSLKEQEEERLRRMEGNEHHSHPQHKSADDLEDGFQIEDERFSLVYDKDGVLIGTPPYSYVPKETQDEMGEEGEESDSEEENGEKGEEEEEGSCSEEEVDRNSSEEEVEGDGSDKAVEGEGSEEEIEGEASEERERITEDEAKEKSGDRRVERVSEGNTANWNEGKEGELKIQN